MLISGLDFLEEVEQKSLNLPIQGGTLPTSSDLLNISFDESMSNDGNRAASSSVTSNLAAQGTQSGRILDFKSTNMTGTNGTVFAMSATSFQLIATTPGT